MTEIEIKKALECKSGDIICAVTDEYNNTYFVYNKNVIDLINRKEAEIDRLKAVEESHREQNGELRTAVERLNFENLQMVASIKGLEERARAEAIKEVYTRLSMNFGTYTDNDSVKLVDLFRLFDQIAKEMGVE